MTAYRDRMQSGEYDAPKNTKKGKQRRDQRSKSERAPKSGTKAARRK